MEVGLGELCLRIGIVDTNIVHSSCFTISYVMRVCVCLGMVVWGGGGVVGVCVAYKSWRYDVCFRIMMPCTCSGPFSVQSMTVEGIRRAVQMRGAVQVIFGRIGRRVLVITMQDIYCFRA